jgi:hypothetical protein
MQPSPTIPLARLRENLIDLTLAWAEPIDPDDPRSVERRGEILAALRATRVALARHELREVRRAD